MLTGRNTMRINDLNTLSEGLQYHVSNNLPLSENIFRPGSEEFFRLIDEARSSFAEGKIDLDWFDQELLNTPKPLKSPSTPIYPQHPHWPPA